MGFICPLLFFLYSDASIKYIFTASDQNGYYKLSNDKILINVIIGDDHSSGFQFVMQYKNINDIYELIEIVNS